MKNLHSISPTYTELQIAYIWYCFMETSKVRVRDGVVEHLFASDTGWNSWMNRPNTDNDKFIMRTWVNAGKPIPDYSKLVK